MKLVQHLVDKKGKIMFLSNDPQTILQSLPSMNIVDGEKISYFPCWISVLLHVHFQLVPKRQRWVTGALNDIKKDTLERSVDCTLIDS